MDIGKIAELVFSGIVSANALDKFEEGPLKKIGNFYNERESKNIKIANIVQDRFLYIARDSEEKALTELQKSTNSNHGLFEPVRKANQHIRQAIVCEKDKNWSERKEQLELAIKAFREFTEDFEEKQKKKKQFNYEIAISIDVYCRYMANHCELILDPKKEKDSYHRQIVPNYIEKIVNKETKKNIKQGDDFLWKMGTLNFSFALIGFGIISSPPITVAALILSAEMILLSKFSNRQSQPEIWHSKKEEILKSEILFFQLTVEELKELSQQLKLES